MGEWEMVVRVVELAGRVGYPMPTVSWVKGVAGKPCVQLYDDGRTLAVHDHVEDLHPPQERDLLIAQELIQARLGGPRHRRRIKTAESIASGLLGATAVLFLRSVTEPWWTAFLLALVGAYGIWMIFHVLLGVIWTRWFTRRADRELADVVGREQVVQWLKRYADAREPVPLLDWARWLAHGAPPTATERLRVLEKA
jgi:hypothetical protein